MNLKRSVQGTLLFMLAGAACAQTASNYSLGGVSAPWLQLSNSARYEGMGEATVAVADDVNALGVNPAGLGQLKDSQVSLMHNAWLQGTAVEQAMGSFALGPGTMGLGFDYLNFGDMERFTLSGGTPVS